MVAQGIRWQKPRDPATLRYRVFASQFINSLSTAFSSANAPTVLRQTATDHALHFPDLSLPSQRAACEDLVLALAHQGKMTA